MPQADFIVRRAIETTLDTLIANLQDIPPLVLCALFVGGLVRGFSGFGAGMIFMPVAASLIAPATAAATFLMVDSLVTLPLIIRAVKLCQWRTVLPAVAAAVVTVHAGAWLLLTTDTLVLRWIICLIVIALLALLLSGWRLHTPPSAGLSAFTGGISGILGGISQVSAPPLVALWLASNKDPAIVRANMIVHFALASIGTFVAYLLAGFFTGDTLRLIAIAAPVYGLAIFLGSRGFGKGGARFYRQIAYGLIGLSVLSSLPALDVWLR